MRLVAMLLLALYWLPCGPRQLQHVCICAGCFVCLRCAFVFMQDLSNPGWLAATALLQALGPALLMNICIVGLNQLYDVEIDRVNKPYLPLASGELSEQQGRWIVAVTGAYEMPITLQFATHLRATTGPAGQLMRPQCALCSLLNRRSCTGNRSVGGLSATAADAGWQPCPRDPVFHRAAVYAVEAQPHACSCVHPGCAVGHLAVLSAAWRGCCCQRVTAAHASRVAHCTTCHLPLFKWVLDVCRAVMVQLGFYFHMKQALGVAQYTMTRPLAFAVGFMLFVSIVIALFKDIPDIQGDRQVPFCRFCTRAHVVWKTINLDAAKSVAYRQHHSHQYVRQRFCLCHHAGWHLHTQRSDWGTASVLGMHRAAGAGIRWSCGFWADFTSTHPAMLMTLTCNCVPLALGRLSAFAFSGANYHAPCSAGAVEPGGHGRGTPVHGSFVILQSEGDRPDQQQSHL
jgi:UbiA prenyltransferase family